MFAIITICLLLIAMFYIMQHQYNSSPSDRMKLQLNRMVFNACRIETTEFVSSIVRHPIACKGYGQTTTQLR